MGTTTLAQSNGKALLIGIEQYENIPALEFVGNDIRLLAEVLSDRCGFEVRQIIDTAVSRGLNRDAILLGDGSVLNLPPIGSSRLESSRLKTSAGDSIQGLSIRPTTPIGPTTHRDTLMDAITTWIDGMTKLTTG